MGARSRGMFQMGLLGLVGAACFGLAVASQAAAYVYWSNDGSPLEGGTTIGRANLDGTGVDETFIGSDVFVNSVSRLEGIAVDSRYLYWANPNGTIGRATVAGTMIDPSFIKGASSPLAVAVDSEHIYWANAGSNAIGRVNLDGSAVDETFIPAGPGAPSVSSPGGVAVNGTYVFWTNSNGTIGRANIDGTDVIPAFITTPNPNGVVANANYVYWSSYSPNYLSPYNPSGVATLGRARIDGTAVNPDLITTASGPVGVAIDAQYIYWATHGGLNAGDTRIGRARLDGSDADQNFIREDSPPFGVAVDAGGSLSPAPRPPVQVGSAKVLHLSRRVVVTETGYVLYTLTPIGRAHVNCSGACTKVWRPLLTDGEPKAAPGSGVKPALLGTIRLLHSRWQVTYHHHPLYTYVYDHPLRSNGQGKKEFRSVWRALNLFGDPIIPAG